MSGAGASADRRMDRRAFLHRTAGGMVLSVVAARTASGTAADTADSAVSEVTLVSEGLALTLHVADGAPAQLRALTNTATRFEWCHPDAFEPVLVLPGGPVTGWVAQAGKKKKQRFEFAARHPSAPVAVQYALAGGIDVPIAEVQADLRNTGASPIEGSLTFGALRLRLRDDLGKLEVHRYQGLSMIEAVDRGEFLLIGVEWADADCRLVERNDGRWIDVEIQGAVAIAPGQRFSIPRVFLGAAHGDKLHAFTTARRYLQRYVFPPRPADWPWVHYNLWGTEGEGVEAAFLQEIDVAADLGIELICHDAAWYEGSSKTGKVDEWPVGLGRYTDDRVKFPNGLAAISRRIHEKGMKFGLWVAPNIVDSRTIGSVIKEEWVAKSNGEILQSRGASTSVQVCLGCPEYVEYVKREFAGAIERFQLDLLRWDQSGYIGTCNRADHGHPADSAHAWISGEHAVYEYLHAKFPKVILERCSGPDFGVARVIGAFGGDLRGTYGPVATASSFRLYPGSYTGAWLVTPPGGGDAELDTRFRAQMAAWFGFATYNGVLRQRISLYPREVLSAARRNIPLYKRFRHLLSEDCYPLVPTPAAGEPRWLAVQFSTPAADEAVVLVFRNQSAHDTVHIPLQALKAGAAYEATFANAGARATLSGAELLGDGLRVSLADPVMSDVIMLRAK